MVGEDPFVLLEGWLRRVLAFDLVLLLLLLVAGPAARVGIRGTAHGFDAIQFASHRRGRGRAQKRRQAQSDSGGSPRRGPTDGNNSGAMGRLSLLGRGPVEKPKWPNGTACCIGGGKDPLKKKLLNKKND